MKHNQTPPHLRHDFQRLLVGGRVLAEGAVPERLELPPQQAHQQCMLGGGRQAVWYCLGRRCGKGCHGIVEARCTWHGGAAVSRDALHQQLCKACEVAAGKQEVCRACMHAAAAAWRTAWLEYRCGLCTNSNLAAHLLGAAASQDAPPRRAACHCHAPLPLASEGAAHLLSASEGAAHLLLASEGAGHLPSAGALHAALRQHCAAPSAAAAAVPEAAPTAAVSAAAAAAAVLLRWASAVRERPRQPH